MDSRSILSPKNMLSANAFEEWYQVSQPLSFGSGTHPQPDGISDPSAAWNAVEIKTARQKEYRLYA